MNMITAFCQQCGYKLKLPAVVRGKTGKCPSCKKPTMIDPDLPSPAAAPANIPTERKWKPSASPQPPAPRPTLPPLPNPPAPVHQPLAPSYPTTTYQQAQWSAAPPQNVGNPYNSPQARNINVSVNVGSAGGGQFSKKEISQLETCTTGLSMIYWGMNAVAGCLIFFILLGLALQIGRPSPGTQQFVGILGVILLIVIVIAAIAQVVGHGILMAAPQRSGGKGFLIAAFVCSIAQPACSAWFSVVAEVQFANRNFEGANTLILVAGILSIGLSVAAFLSHFLGLGKLFDFSIDFGSRPRAILWACLIWLVILVFGAVLVALNPREQGIAIGYAITVVVLPLGIIISYVRMLGTSARYLRDLTRHY